MFLAVSSASSAAATCTRRAPRRAATGPTRSQRARATARPHRAAGGGPPPRGCDRTPVPVRARPVMHVAMRENEGVGWPCTAKQLPALGPLRNAGQRRLSRCPRGYPSAGSVHGGSRCQFVTCRQPAPTWLHKERPCWRPAFPAACASSPPRRSPPTIVAALGDQSTVYGRRRAATRPDVRWWSSVARSAAVVGRGREGKWHFRFLGNVVKTAADVSCAAYQCVGMSKPRIMTILGIGAL